MVKRIVQCVLWLISLLVVLLFLQLDTMAVQFTNAFVPDMGKYVGLLLVVLEIWGAIILYKSLFARPAKLILKLGASEEERAAFCRELKVRLQKNPHVRSLGLDPKSKDYLPQAMAHLDKLAEEEIRSQGKAVFLGTALSQNGRLDALIMFFALTRMVWRISKIYNQKPTPQELWSVFGTVTSSTFVAFSIEALDIPQTITDTMNELVPAVTPAMAASSMPLVGSALHVFTASLMDGAANSLLCVRAGVITKRAYNYAWQGGSVPRSCVKEVGSIMLEISNETLTQIVHGLKRTLTDLSVESGKKLAKSAGEAVTNLGKSCVDTVKSGVDIVGQGTSAVYNHAVQSVESGKQLAKSAGEAVTNLGKSCVDTVKSGAGVVGQHAVQTVESGKKLAKSAGEAVTNLGKSCVETVKSGVDVVGQGTSAVYNHAVQSVESGKQLAKSAGEAVTNLGKSCVDTVKSGADVVGQHAVQTVESGKQLAKSAGEAVTNLGKSCVDTVKSGVDVVGQGTSAVYNHAVQSVESGKKLVKSAGEAVTNLGKSCVDTVKSGADVVGQGTSAVYNHAVQSVESGKKLAKSAGEAVTNLGKSCIDTVKSGADVVGQHAVQTVESGKKLAKSAGEAVTNLGKNVFYRAVKPFKKESAPDNQTEALDTEPENAASEPKKSFFKRGFQKVQNILPFKKRS